MQFALDCMLRNCSVRDPIDVIHELLKVLQAVVSMAATTTKTPLPVEQIQSLSAWLGIYPESGVTPPANSYVTVVDKQDGSLEVTYDIKASDSSYGGLHIHAGTGCDDVADPKGHYWKDAASKDPWTTTVDLNSDGSAQGSFNLDSGFNYDDNINHVVVLHDDSGVKIACGVLVASTNGEGGEDGEGGEGGEGGSTDDNTIIIDVRTQDEWDDGHISCAKGPLEIQLKVAGWLEKVEVWTGKMMRADFGTWGMVATLLCYGGCL